MKRVFFCLTALALILLSLPSCADRQRHTASFFFMDTVITVTLYSKDSDLAQEKLTECEALLGELDNLWSRHISKSDIARLNASPDGLQELDARTVQLLRQAQEISASTQGAFDITLAPLSDLWQACGAENRMPTEEELAALLALTGTDRLELTEAGVHKPAGIQIDLGAIAKGAAISVLAEAVSASGITGGLISFGSNVTVFGEKPDGSPYRIALRNPKDTERTVGTLTLPAGAVLSVSGDYERYVTVNGGAYHHILDPSTGYPAASGLSSVSVICDDGALADALSTALLVMGYEGAMAYYASGDYAFEAIFITSEGEIFTTPGITDFILS